MHAGMSYRRLEDLGGIQWPCYDEQHPGELFLHARLWEEDPARRGAPAPFTPVENDPPVDQLSPEFPLRLTTGRRLDSFNTGVQTEHYATPIRRPETLNLSPEDATRLGLAEGEVVRVSSRRGSLEVPVHIDEIAPGRARVHDPALPRPGRDQHPHPRRLGPQVRHGRVQGHGHPGGQARRHRPGRQREPSARRRVV